MPEPVQLLEPGEAEPVEIRNAGGRSPFLILCDHAGRAVPGRLGDLGVSAAEMERHIAWDIGCASVSAGLSEALDAVMIGQRYSRLVIDCNRAPGHPTSIPAVSDGTAVPGNVGLSGADAEARRVAIFEPYHAAIAAELERRAGRATVVIAMHSFTPVFGACAALGGGVLFDRDPGYALAVGALLREDGLLVGDNEPYQLSDASDYTVPVHAEGRGLPYVELEIRQDLIAEADGQRRWTALLARVLPAAWERVGVGVPGWVNGCRAAVFWVGAEPPEGWKGEPAACGHSRPLDPLRVGWAEWGKWPIC